jgi:hypothetical protein
MPYTNEFLGVRNHFKRQYSDSAKVEFFSFMEAQKQGIRIIDDRARRIKRQIADSSGNAAIWIVIFLFFLAVYGALHTDFVSMIDIGRKAITGDENAVYINIIFLAIPILFVIMMFVWLLARLSEG